MHEIMRRQYITQYHWLPGRRFEAPDELHAFLMDPCARCCRRASTIDKHSPPATARAAAHRHRPDGDLFAALREGKASVVTDTIDTFTEHG